MALPNMAMIPSGYKPTKLYSVLPTPSYGSELVTNGNFSNGSTDWILGSGWSVSNGKAIAVSSPSGQSIQQSSVAASLPNGSLAEVSFEVLSITQGSFGIYFSGTLVGSLNSVGVFSVNFTKGTETSFYIRALGTTSGSIDNISVKEVFVGDADFDVTRATPATRVNQYGLIETPEFILSGELVTNGDFSDGTTDWIFSDSAFLTSLGAQITTVPNVGSIQQISVLVIGKKYKLTYEITEKVSGNLKLDSAIDNSLDTSLGVHYKYFEADRTVVIISRTGSNVDITIDNISIVEVERNNIPRLDYTDGGCPVLLTEPQSTNLIPYSQDFSQWTAEESTVSLNTLETLSPDGTYNATILAENTSFGKHGVVRTVTSGGNSYSFSFFAKYKTRQYISIVTSDDVYWQSQVVVDLSNGSITKEYSRSYTVTNKVEDFGNGWYKISSSIIGAYNTRVYSRIYLSNVAVPSDPPNNFYVGESSSVYIWGAQLEALPYSTSYIPTNGAASTRNQDVVDNAGTSATYNSEEGVLFAEIAALVDSTDPTYVSLSDGTVSNRICILLQDVRVRPFYYLNNVQQLAFSISVGDNSVSRKIAFKYKENDFSVWIDGVEVASNTSGSTFPINTLNELTFDNGGGGNPFYGKTKQVQVFNTALSNFDLLNLTSNATGYATYETMRTSLNFNIQ